MVHRWVADVPTVPGGKSARLGGCKGSGLDAGHKRVNIDARARKACMVETQMSPETLWGQDHRFPQGRERLPERDKGITTAHGPRPCSLRIKLKNTGPRPHRDVTYFQKQMKQPVCTTGARKATNLRRVLLMC